MFKAKYLLRVMMLVICGFTSQDITAQGKLNKTLRLDGLYNTYDTTIGYFGKKANEIYTTNGPIIFLKNYKIICSNFVTTDDTVFKKGFYARFVPEEIGTYRIEGDSIFAILPTYFYIGGMRSRLYSTNYSAYIKNQDTIIGWKMVPPYPEAKAKHNGNFVHVLTPRLLYFIKNDAVTALEEIANKEVQSKKKKK